MELIASRPVGRPEIRRMDTVMRGIQAMKTVNWKRCALDRNRWKLIAEQAKTQSCSALYERMTIYTYCIHHIVLLPARPTVCHCSFHDLRIRHYATSRKVAVSRFDELNDFFSVYLVLPAALGAGVYSASNRNEYQKQG
jgi:hypothetical protein